MAKGDIHTEFDRKTQLWVNKVEGAKRPSNNGERKSDVQADGREMAIKREVEKERNKITERNTYLRSRDPHRSKG